MTCIYVDGGTRKSQICMYDPQKYKTVIKVRGNRPTNNELEYLALIYGLEYVKNNYRNQHIIIYSDSMLVVQQVNKNWRITTKNLKILHDKCMKLMRSNFHIKWIGRESNLAGWVLENEKGR